MLDDLQAAIRTSIESWLAEDVGTGDITSMATIPSDHQSKAIIHTKQAGLLAGIPIAEAVFRIVDGSLVFQAAAVEGSRIQRGDVIAEVEGNTRSILKAERLALNLLQRLSGIATKTSRFIEQLEGWPVRVVDTRKTTPGLRILEKYAVRVGGGSNHRFGLYDAVLIKDNHIKACGGIGAAVATARSRIPHTMKIEVEVENEAQIEEALEAKADIIMLDNMSIPDMKLAVERIKAYASHVLVEASGGVSIDTVKSIAATGVDVISAGSLTYSFDSLDISLDLFDRKGHQS